MAVVASHTAAAFPADAVGVGTVGWESSGDGDHVSAELVTDPVVGSLADQGVVAAACTPRSNLTKHATILYRDALGQPTFAWHHDVTYSYNCKVVTRISHRSYAEVFQPQYTFAGYLANSISPAGHRKATATAQGRFGICDDTFGDTCLLERDPSIVWHVDAGGKAYATSTP